MNAARDLLNARILGCLEQKKSILERMQKSFEYTQEVEDMNATFIRELESTESALVDFYNRFTTKSS